MCRFHGNSGGTAAGGLEVGFAAAGDPQFTNEIHVHNTEFDENFAQRGGASFIVVPQQAGILPAIKHTVASLCLSLSVLLCLECLFVAIDIAWGFHYVIVNRQ